LDEDDSTDPSQPDQVYGDQWQRGTRDELTIAAGTDLALAVGAGAARLARAATVRPCTAAVAGALRLGEHALAGGSGHPLLASLATRGESMGAGLERAAAGAARATLRWAVEGAVSTLDLTELVRAHVDLDELAAAIDVDAVVARADVDAVVARTDLDAALDRLDLDAVVARVDLDAVLSRIDLNAIL
jgi:hypothetical protein